MNTNEYFHSYRPILKLFVSINHVKMNDFLTLNPSDGRLAGSMPSDCPLKRREVKKESDFVGEAAPSSVE